MPIVLIEGPRKSGKSYLLKDLNNVFKFDFLSSFVGLNLEQNSNNTHFFGLGKEIMLMQLNKDLFIKDTLLIDRGIITNAVWGVLQNRISLDTAENQISWAINSNLFEGTSVILIEGTSTEERKKDLWDFADSMVEEEKALFQHFYKYIIERGVKGVIFRNNFDDESLHFFTEQIKLY